MNANKYQAYISGALTAVWEKLKLKALYEDIGNLCSKKSINCYIPHLHKSLDKDPNIPLEEIFNGNMEQIDKSNILIAYVGTPSQGVGMEIERAHIRGLDVVVLAEKGKKVSRMVRGCPAVIHHIEFTNFEDAMNQLDSCLDKWLKMKGSAN